MSSRRRVLCAIMLPMVAGGPAYGGTFYAAAANGSDVPGCGAKNAPCRSISAAIQAASDGDTVVVGPGRYGDANQDGDLFDPGDEFGVPFCGCLIGIDRAVTVVSSDGAGATVIDATQIQAVRTVLFVTDGATLGKKGKGFTITNPFETGMAVDIFGVTVLGGNNAVQGNQLDGIPRIGMTGTLSFGTGIEVADTATGPIVIEGNQLTGWNRAIDVVGPAATMVRKNQTRHNAAGISVDDDNAELVGNVANRNNTGLVVRRARTVLGNAVIGNRDAGASLSGTFDGVFTKNNVFGNRDCGVSNLVSGLDLSNNFWGATTGPGPYPANDVCATPAVVEPFAAKPFTVKAPVRF